VVSFMMPKRPGTTRGSQSGTDAEHNCRGKRYKWQKDSGPGHYGSHSTRHDGGHWGVYGVHETEPAADKISSQKVAQCSGGESDNDF
jgi:hypothetical protein